MISVAMVGPQATRDRGRPPPGCEANRPTRLRSRGSSIPADCARRAAAPESAASRATLRGCPCTWGSAADRHLPSVRPSRSLQAGGSGCADWSRTTITHTCRKGTDGTGGTPGRDWPGTARKNRGGALAGQPLPVCRRGTEHSGGGLRQRVTRRCAVDAAVTTGVEEIRRGGGGTEPIRRFTRPSVGDMRGMCQTRRPGPTGGRPFDQGRCATLSHRRDARSRVPKPRFGRWMEVNGAKIPVARELPAGWPRMPARWNPP